MCALLPVSAPSPRTWPQDHNQTRWFKLYFETFAVTIPADTSNCFLFSVMMSIKRISARVCFLDSFPHRSKLAKSLPLPLRLSPWLPQPYSSSASKRAQPIDLTSGTDETSAATSVESSNLPHHVISRASTDRTARAVSSSRKAEAGAASQKDFGTRTRTNRTKTNLSVATVTRTGTMASTVQLTAKIQSFDRQLQKPYTRPSRLLAHDPHPAGFLREGDTVEYSLFNDEEMAAKEEKRLTLENRLIAKGVIRLKTRKGKERSLKEVGVQPRGPRWIVRRVVTPFGEGIEERTARYAGAGGEKA